MRLLGAVLAGGRSRRFGSDKALALIDGRPLVEHAVDGLAAWVESVVICGMTHSGLTTIADRPSPDLGPLGGLAAALHHARANGYDAVLTSGCDTPSVPSVVWQRLVGDPDGAVVGDLPIIGCWPARLSPALDAHLAAGGDRSVRRWVRECGIATIAAPPIANINSPCDLASAVDRRAE